MTLAAVSAVFALALLELAFRVFDVGPEIHSPCWLEAIVPAGQPREMAPYGFIPHAIIRSHYDSDPRGYLRLSDLVQVPGHEVETINAGILGTNTVYHLGSLRHRGLEYRPDLVVLLFVPNDVEVAGRHSREGRVELFGFTDDFVSSRAYSSGLRVADWAHQIIDRRVQTRRYLREAAASFSRSGEGWLECSRALVDMAAICRANDIPLVVGLCPFMIDLDGDYPFRVVHDAVMEVCREHEIVCVDLLSHFSGCRGPELWVHPTDQHPNEIAHAMAAGALAPVIRAALVERVCAAETPPAGPQG